ncbi:hypothetical protein KOW79_015907 [Hemibagrus wyckioides]|uniref:Uncharacterized protein n=1 Tax=Hemibagrus wyckioides TaxID=337641 RepID=A0A9D3NFX9_9TELE|nr:hypothetical protein KOW79_015907 [Hemibagrus wyckioides]
MCRLRFLLRSEKSDLSEEQADDEEDWSVTGEARQTTAAPEDSVIQDCSLVWLPVDRGKCVSRRVVTRQAGARPSATLTWHQSCQDLRFPPDTTSLLPQLPGQ